MELQIPENAYKGLRLLSELPEDKILDFFNFFREIKPTFFWEEISQKYSANESGEIESIVKAIKGLYSLELSENLSSEQIANDVIAAINKSNEIKDINAELLKKRLIEVLSFDKTLGITAKASDIMFQHEHVLVGEARILTDIRPIFSSDIEVNPPAAVIIHNLKISYFENEEKKEFFVALDSNDLKMLAKVIDRAISKEKQITSICSESEMKILKVAE
jgi:hypothetical protein